MGISLYLQPAICGMLIVVGRKAGSPARSLQTLRKVKRYLR